MIDTKSLQEDGPRLAETAKLKGFDVDIDRLLELDRQRRDLTQEVEQQRIARKGRQEELREADENTRKAAATKRRELQALEGELQTVEEEWRDLLLRVPGELAPNVPPGSTDADNVEIRRWGTPKPNSGEPPDHVKILNAFGALQRDRAVEIAGSRAYALTGIAARLEQAVLRFAWDLVVEEGAEPVSPPILLRRDAFVATGFFPNGEEDTYRIPDDNLYLTGTSEVALVAMAGETTLTDDDLPRRFVAASTCFRREAGAAGRDTRGLYRVHQFQKVEQVSISRPTLEDQEAEHLRLLELSEKILKMLELPHRVALASAGETGFGQYRKHEVETWMPSRDSYCETHSCSSLLDFQARRCRLRYRGSARNKFAYTLNNTAIAAPRILIPLVENHWNGEAIAIPEALRPYLGGQSEISLEPAGHR